MNSLNVIFLLYLLVLVLMAVKYMGMKKSPSANELFLHGSLMVALGALVLYTLNKDRESYVANLDYKVSSLNKVEGENKDPLRPLVPKFNVSKSEGRLPNYTGAELDYRMSAKNSVENPKHENRAVDEREDLHKIVTFNNSAPLDYKMSALNGVEGEVVIPGEEHFQNSNSNKDKKDVEGTVGKDGAAPLNYRMGPYSQVKLDAEKHQNRRQLMPGFTESMFLNEKKSNCGPLSSPCNMPLVQPKFITPMGEEDVPEMSHEYKPSVDGTKDGPKSMFMFSHNVCSPGCCPSTYSCDHGCVCTTKNQREYLSRGGVMKKN